jgi:hypothetical protein
MVHVKNRKSVSKLNSTNVGSLGVVVVVVPVFHFLCLQPMLWIFIRFTSL